MTRALDGQAQANWAAVAAEHGYCDQAHLIDEFQDLADITLGDYLPSRIDGPNHVRV